MGSIFRDEEWNQRLNQMDGHMKKRYLSWLLVLPLLLVAGGCKKQKQTITITLIDELPRARISAKKSDHVVEKSYRIGGEKRRVLFMHPPSTAEFDLLVPAQARLSFGFTLSQAVWQKPGDGVLFKVELDEGTAERVELFSQYINPKTVAPDRKWHDAEIDLSLYEGQRVTLIFATDPGPNNNNAFDHAAWSEPMLTGVGW
jgi:hypothetical protein